MAFVQWCLDEDSQCGSKKQHHTAKRIYDRLVEECEFTGGETTVRRLVKELREKEQEALFSKWADLFERTTMVAALIDRFDLPKPCVEHERRLFPVKGNSPICVLADWLIYS